MVGFSLLVKANVFTIVAVALAKEPEVNVTLAGIEGQLSPCMRFVVVFFIPRGILGACVVLCVEDICSVKQEEIALNAHKAYGFATVLYVMASELKLKSVDNQLVELGVNGDTCD